MDEENQYEEMSFNEEESLVKEDSSLNKDNSVDEYEEVDFEEVSFEGSEETEPEELSFSENISNTASNIWEGTKVVDNQIRLLGGNIEDRISDSARELSIEGMQFLRDHANLPLSDIIRYTKDKHKEIKKNREHEIAGTNEDPSELFMLSPRYAGNDIKAIQEYSKNIKPTEELIGAFESGSPVKMASAITGTLMELGDSVVKGVLTFGAHTVASPMAQSYSQELLDKAEREDSDPLTLLSKDKDNEFLPVVSGVFQAALEKIGFDKVTGSTLKNVPAGFWKKALDVAMTGGVEGLTEFLQDGIGQVEKSLENEEDVLSEEYWSAEEGGFNWRQAIESGAKGTAGGASMASIGKVSNYLTETKIDDSIKDEDIETITKIGDIDVDLELEKLTKETKESVEGITQEIPVTDKPLLEEDGQISIPFEEASIELETQGEINQAKFDKESEDLLDSLTERADKGEISQEEASILFEKSYGEFKEKYKIKNNPEITEEYLEEPYELTTPDRDALKEMDEMEVLYNESGSFKRKDLQKVKEIRDSIKKNGANESDINAIAKLRNARINEEIRKKKLKFKNITTSQIGKAVGKLKSFTTKTNEISGLNQDSMDFLDKYLKNPLDKVITKVDRILRNERELLNHFINENKITDEDLTTVGIYGFINSTKADPKDIEAHKAEIEERKVMLLNAVDAKINDARKSSRLTRLVKGSTLDQALKEKQIAMTMIARMEEGGEGELGSALSANQSFLNEYARDIYSNTLENYKHTSKVYHGKELEVLHNYSHTKALGGWKEEVGTNEMAKEINNKVKKEDKITRKRRPKVSQTGAGKERTKGSKTLFYDFNTANLLMDYVKSTQFQINGAKTVKDITSLLSDKKISDSLGKGSTDALMRGVRAYVNKEQGVRRSQLVKGIDKIKSSVVTTMLGSIGQLPKQFIPAVSQAYVLANGNPVVYAKALKALSTTSEEWYMNNAPSVYERSLSMDRLTFGGDEAFFKTHGKGKVAKAVDTLKKASETASSTPISMGDIGAARLAFLTSYIRQGGDMDNVDSKLIRRAQSEQESLQNVNSSAFAGEVFNSDKDLEMVLARTLLTFTNFSLQQMFAFQTGVKNMDKAKGRRLALGAFSSAMTYAATTSVINGIWDETLDKLTGEDDITDDDEIVEEGLLVKSAIRGGVDVLLGGVPIGREFVQGVVEEINNAYFSDEEEDDIFYISPGSSIDDVLGAAISSPLEAMMNILNNSAKGINGSENGYKIAAVHTARLFNYMSAFLPIPRGNLDAVLRRLGTEYKEEQKLLDKSSSDPNARKTDNRNASRRNSSRAGTERK